MAINEKQLTDEYLESVMPRIIQSFKEFGILEDGYEAAIEEFKENYSKVLNRKGSNYVSQEIIFRRALGKTMASKDKTRGGSLFDIFILKYSEPRDWNADEMEAILKAWQTGGLKARAALIKSGKVASLKVGENERKALKNITKWEISKKTKAFVPIAGEFIRDDDLPALIDMREDSKKKTYPLEENWNINVYGIVKIKDTFLPFNLSIYDNELAKPESEKFLPAGYPAFNEYKVVASLNQDRTKETNGRYVYLGYLKGISKIEPEEEIAADDMIYRLVNAGIIKSFKECKENIEDYPYDIFLVDIEDHREFHDKVMAKRDKAGNIMKTPSGYDKTNFEKFGVGIYQCSDKTPTTAGNHMLRFMDYTGKATQGFTSKYIEEPPFDEDLPQDAIVTFATVKKPTRWDRESNVNIDDPINGDISLGTLMDVLPLKHMLDEDE